MSDPWSHQEHGPTSAHTEAHGAVRTTEDHVEVQHYAALLYVDLGVPLNSALCAEG